MEFTQHAYEMGQHTYEIGQKGIKSEENILR